MQFLSFTSSGYGDRRLPLDEGQQPPLPFQYLLPNYTPPPAPTITNINPNTGSTAGGTNVTITGTNFVTGAGNTIVTFGGTAATGINVASATSLTCTTPAHTAGAVNVVVTTDGGTATSTNGFTYTAPPAPTVTALNPTSGSTGGGTSVTITGTNLTGATAVSFGGTAATGVSVVNATTVNCTSPAHAAGTIDVTVTTPGGTSATTGTGQRLHLHWRGCPHRHRSQPDGRHRQWRHRGDHHRHQPHRRYRGQLRRHAATNVAVVNATTITCKTPAHAAGTIDVTSPLRVALVPPPAPVTTTPTQRRRFRPSPTSIRIPALRPAAPR